MRFEALNRRVNYRGRIIEIREFSGRPVLKYVAFWDGLFATGRCRSRVAARKWAKKYIDAQLGKP